MVHEVYRARIHEERGTKDRFHWELGTGNWEPVLRTGNWELLPVQFPRTHSQYGTFDRRDSYV